MTSGIKLTDALIIEDSAGGVLRLLGEIDMATAPILQQRLEGDRSVTVLDLQEVTFVDSSGLMVLVRASRERADRLALRSPTEAVRRVLELTGLAAEFLIDG